ncbi:RagB/SusD family nutrient uptake outer membrane protein [Pedobacter sp. GR22-6]|uniref:RagB/SusD family nutrient uptake outer membrane protein n=1 Tax=Pedobacter sp. GR22-6 TaxID=3127957 RepID=UPI00307F0FC5
MRNLFIYICVAGIVSLSSCKKFLDVKPKGTLIPTSVADYDHLLDFSTGLELNFVDAGRGSNLSYLTDNLAISEGQAKVGFILNNHPNIGRYYSFIFRQPYNDPRTYDYFWSANSNAGAYPQVSYFNNIIEGIRGVDKKTPTEETLAKTATAQALVGRAWCYFNLNLIYGPVYKPGENNDTKTVPYVTSPDLGTAIPQLSTSEEMMKHVAKDLYAALPNLPSASGWPSRANKGTGYAMLANYHLFTKRYDSVAYYANLAWDNAGGEASKLIYDYNTFSVVTPNTNEWTAALRTTQDNLHNLVNHREMLFYRGTDNNAGIGTSLSYPSAELIGLYNQTSDLRFKLFFINSPGYNTTLGGGYNDGTRISNYRFNKTKMTDGFTYPEVLLMRAEGYARTNRLDLAIADLNALRQRRYVTGTPALTVGTQDQVIQQVLDERRRELPIGGLKRFLDLKRLVLDTGKPWSKAQVVHTIGNNNYTGRVDSPDFVFNIVNTVLQFNPGWGRPLDTRPFN